MLVALSLPTMLPAQSGTNPPKMTPSERDAAMRKLQGQSDIFYRRKLDPTKTRLQQVMTRMRDSIELAAGIASRIERAHAAHSTAVEISQGRLLQVQCHIAARVADSTLVELGPLSTSDSSGDRALAAYRKAVKDVAAVTGECDKTLGEVFLKTPVAPERIGTVGSRVAEASSAHGLALRELSDVLEIPIRPFGYQAVHEQ